MGSVRAKSSAQAASIAPPVMAQSSTNSAEDRAAKRFPQRRRQSAGRGGNAAVRQLRTEPEKQSGKHGERTEYGDAGSKAVAGEEADKLPAGGKARADNAAQKCQRTKKDIHAVPP